jgi:hypothetical protein
MAIDRTAYNLLVDDAGDGISGSVWDKSDVNDLIVAADAADAAIVALIGGPITRISVPGVSITLVNGRNDNVVIGNTSFVRSMSGPTAAFSISGIVPQAVNPEGTYLTLFHNAGQVLTMLHNDVNSTAANRIYIAGSANRTTATTFGTVMLQYNNLLPGWILLTIA